MYWFHRKWDPRQQQGADQDGKLTIEQIESMHQTGQISDEEFTAMRRVAMGLDSTAEKNSESSCGGGRIVDSENGKLYSEDEAIVEKDSE